MNLRKAGIAAIGALALGGGTLALLPGAAGAKPVKDGQGSSDDITATGILIQSRASSRFTFVASGSSSHPCSLVSYDDQLVNSWMNSVSVRCTLVATGTVDQTGVNGTIRVTSTDGTITLPFHNNSGCGTERQRGGAVQTIFAFGDLVGDPTPTNVGSISTTTVHISINDVPTGQTCAP